MRRRFRRDVGVVRIVAGGRDDIDPGRRGDRRDLRPRPVPSLIPRGADAHEYESSTRDADRIRGAGLVVANGLGLESGLADAIDAARSDGVAVYEVGPTMSPRLGSPRLDGPRSDGDRGRGTGTTSRRGGRPRDVGLGDPNLQLDLRQVAPRPRPGDGCHHGRGAGRAPQAGDQPRGARLLRRPVRLRGDRRGHPVAQLAGRGKRPGPRDAGRHDAPRGRDDGVRRDEPSEAGGGGAGVARR